MTVERVAGTTRVAWSGIVTGLAPQLNVTTGDALMAACSAVAVQLGAVPLPTTRAPVVLAATMGGVQTAAGAASAAAPASAAEIASNPARRAGEPRTAARRATPREISVKRWMDMEILVTRIGKERGFCERMAWRARILLFHCHGVTPASQP